MAIVSDAKVDRDLALMKRRLEGLKRTHLTLSSSFRTMPAKERARLIHEIESTVKELLQFIGSTRSMEIHNSGTKFGIENLKQGVQSFTGLWKKTFKNMEKSAAGPQGSMEIRPPTNPVSGASQTPGSVDASLGEATRAYAQILRDLGYQASSSAHREFERKLSRALKNAENQYPERELKVSVVAENGKVKVKIVPR